VTRTGWDIFPVDNFVVQVGHYYYTKKANYSSDPQSDRFLLRIIDLANLLYDFIDVPRFALDLPVAGRMIIASRRK
jgi:hypothetical protein